MQQQQEVPHQQKEDPEQQHERLGDVKIEEELDEDLRELTPDEVKHEALKQELEELQQEQSDLRAAADAGAKAF